MLASMLGHFLPVGAMKYELNKKHSKINVKTAFLVSKTAIIYARTDI